MYQEKQYIQQQVLNKQAVTTVSGKIRQFKYFTVGKGDTHAKIKLSGINKWLMLGEVSKAEEKQLQKGQTITAEVYPPKDGLFVKQYNLQHTLRTLGIQSNGQTLRTSEAAKQQLTNSNHLFTIAAILMFVVSSIGLYFTWKAKVNNT